MEELLEKSQLKHFIIALAQNLYNRRKHFGPNFSIDLDELQLFGDKVFGGKASFDNKVEFGEFIYLDDEFGKKPNKGWTIVEKIRKKNTIRRFTEFILEKKPEEIKQVLEKLFQDDNGGQTMYVANIQTNSEYYKEDLDLERIDHGSMIYCCLVPLNDMENSFIIKYIKSKV